VAARTLARRARKQSPAWWKWTKRTIVTLFIVGCAGALVFGYIFYGELQKAESKITNLPSLMDQVAKQPSYIYSADNKILYQISAEFRKPVKYDDIPVNVRNAVLAAEDKRFFDHGGVDPIAIGRTLFTTVKSRAITQGGSTLTMQLAKLLYTNSEKTFKRKMGDVAMAVAMERKLTKEQILELYMNKVYFGAGAHGIQAAADVYFGKTVDKLTIGEAALLARLVRRPSDENPFHNPERAIENRNVVLRIMRDENMITSEEYDKALAEKPTFTRRIKGSSERFYRARYFVWHVLETLHKDPRFEDINLADGGYKIYTTLDTRMQKVAEDAVRETVRDHKRDKVTTAAFVAINSEGKILCEVGGVDFDKNQYNVVTSGLRQPGSSFKPFVYATAFSTGALAINGTVSNERFTWEIPGSKGWTPRNSNSKSGGIVSVQSAFKFSMNIPAAHVMQMTGPQNVLSYVKSNFGFTSPRLVGRPSMCLGAEEVSPLEMARAYSVFMLRGDRAEPYCIDRIVKPNGEPILNRPVITKGVLDANVSDQIDALMRAVVTSGTGTRASIVPNARGKTGTTSDNRDAWFCGYADGIVGIGWVANEVRRPGRPAGYLPMGSSVFGGKVTVEFWAQIMKYAQKEFGHETDRPSLSRIMATFRRDEPKPDEHPDDPTDQIDPMVPTPDQIPIEDPGQPGTLPATDPANGNGTDPQGTTPPVSDPKPPVTTPNKPKSNPPVDQNTNEKDMVEVEICADTGMRASIYCPETVTRKFPKGKEPQKRCTKHGG